LAQQPFVAKLGRVNKGDLLQRVMGTKSIDNSSCTCVGHSQVERLFRLQFSGRCSCGGLEPVSKAIASTGTFCRSRLTEMEVVVLGVADNEQANDGMDNS
jgi:hypothetical protein